MPHTTKMKFYSNKTNARRALGKAGIPSEIQNEYLVKNASGEWGFEVWDGGQPEKRALQGEGNVANSKTRSTDKTGVNTMSTPTNPQGKSMFEDSDKGTASEAGVTRKNAPATGADDKAKQKAADAEAKAKAKAEAKEKREAEKAAKAAAKKEEAERKKAEREANKMPVQNGVRKRKPGTKCGDCWDIFDLVSKQRGQPCAVSEAFAHIETLPKDEQAKFNKNNVQCEYAAWRKYHGVEGRIESAEKIAKRKAEQEARAKAKAEREKAKAEKAKKDAEAKAKAAEKAKTPAKGTGKAA